jgi:hypothetical protein
MATIKKAPGGALIKKGLKALGTTSGGVNTPMGKSLSKKVKEANFQKNKGKFGMEGENVTLKDFSKKRLLKELGPPADYTPKSTRPMLTDAQKANNAKILQEIKDGKRKTGGSISKAKSGSKVKKAQTGGYTFPKAPDEGKFLIGETGPMRKTKVKQRSESGDYVTKTVTRERKGAKNVSTKTRRTLQGFMNHAPKVSELKKNGGKMKSGGKMKTCKGGC